MVGVVEVKVGVGGARARESFMLNRYSVLIQVYFGNAVCGGRRLGEGNGGGGALSRGPCEESFAEKGAREADIANRPISAHVRSSGEDAGSAGADGELNRLSGRHCRRLINPIERA